MDERDLPGTRNNLPNRTPIETADLTRQTPGLDETRPLRDAGIRVAAWVREQPGIALGILGGLVVLGVGLTLALRRREPTMLERARAKLPW